MLYNELATRYYKYIDAKKKSLLLDPQPHIVILK